MDCIRYTSKYMFRKLFYLLQKRKDKKIAEDKTILDIIWLVANFKTDEFEPENIISVIYDTETETVKQISW